MKKITTLFVLLTMIAFGVKAQVHVTTIDSVRISDANGVPLDTGVTVQISGVVYGPNAYPTANGMVFYLNDHKSGIKIYSKHKYAGYTTLTDGDSVVVIGQVGAYHGADEINLSTSSPLDTIYKVGVGQLDTPTVILANGLNEQTYGTLMQVNNVNMTIATGWGPVAGKHAFNAVSGGLYMYIDSFVNATMYNAPLPQGIYNVVGMGDQYKYAAPFTSGFQIDPRGLFDFHLVSNPNGINEVDNKLTAAIYPNPASTQLMVALSNDKDETITAQIFDVTGRVVLSETKNLTNGMNTLQFNTANITNGMYILELNTAEKSLNTKIVIAR